MWPPTRRQRGGAIPLAALPSLSVNLSGSGLELSSWIRALALNEARRLGVK